MPMAALMLAVGGAFAFNTANLETDAFAPETGYIDGIEPCSISIECDTEGTVLCQDLLGNIAYGRDGQNCERELFMPRPQ